MQWAGDRTWNNPTFFHMKAALVKSSPLGQCCCYLHEHFFISAFHATLSILKETSRVVMHLSSYFLVVTNIPWAGTPRTFLYATCDACGTNIWPPPHCDNEYYKTTSVQNATPELLSPKSPSGCTLHTCAFQSVGDNTWHVTYALLISHHAEYLCKLCLSTMARQLYPKKARSGKIVSLQFWTEVCENHLVGVSFLSCTKAVYIIFFFLDNGMQALHDCCYAGSL